VTDLAGIDDLILATPVLAGKAPPYVTEYLSRLSGGEGKPFHGIAGMGSRGSEGTIAMVRNQLEKKGMGCVSSAAPVGKDVDSGAFISTPDVFASAIRYT
jgi:hypothetical protein